MARAYHIFAGEVVITTGGNDLIRFKEDGGATLEATVVAGSYYLAVDEASATSLLDAVTDALTTRSGEAGGLGRTYVSSVGWLTPAGACTCTVDVSTTGDTVQFIASGTTFALPTIGFAQADSVVGETIEGTVSPTYSWVSNTATVNEDGDSDARDVVQLVTPDGQISSLVISDVMESRHFQLASVLGERTLKEIATSADYGRAFENFWRNVVDGRRVRVYSVAAASVSSLADPVAADLVGTYVMATDNEVVFAPLRHPNVDLWDFEFTMRKYVA